VVQGIELRALCLLGKGPNTEPGSSSFDVSLFYRSLPLMAFSHDPTTSALQIADITYIHHNSQPYFLIATC
jgi:hypothetical protein